MVQTGQAAYVADRLILCGGAWSNEWLADVGVKITVTRQALAWVWPKSPEMFAPSVIPAWSVGHADGSMHYGFPMLPDNPGLKIALHKPGEITEPRSLVRTPVPADEQSFRPFLSETVPDADGPTVAIRICMYENSPDGHFILDSHPIHKNILLACGFSGHGFKFATVIGEALADLAINGKTNLPIDFLSLRRFRVA